MTYWQYQSNRLHKCSPNIEVSIAWLCYQPSAARDRSNCTLPHWLFCSESSIEVGKRSRTPLISDLHTINWSNQDNQIHISLCCYLQTCQQCNFLPLHKFQLQHRQTKPLANVNNLYLWHIFGYFEDLLLSWRSYKLFHTFWSNCRQNNWDCLGISKHTIFDLCHQNISRIQCHWCSIEGRIFERLGQQIQYNQWEGRIYDLFSEQRVLDYNQKES